MTERKYGQGFVMLAPVLGKGLRIVASERRSAKRRGDLSSKLKSQWTLLAER